MTNETPTLENYSDTCQAITDRLGVLEKMNSDPTILHLAQALRNMVLAYDISMRHVRKLSDENAILLTKLHKYESE